ncbi:MAG TPA: radical SAM protein [Planctomycetaceae bacterium]|nr:radical SAM protein [Planctomycetaceae bacterium]
MSSAFTRFSGREIVAARPARNRVDSEQPYAFLVEPERSAAGTVVDVATVFLTNRECPFRCLMCDLWKNTTEEPVPPGAIPRQIDYALERLPPAVQIKLYNSGNFFDAKAIPRSDFEAIAGRVRSFENVIVENHPCLCSMECVRFRDRLGTALEIALGLETVHPGVLPALNKQMTLDDFARAVEFLTAHDVAVRAFILLRPPFLSDAEGVEWALRSVEFAFSLGVGCCSIIPARAGNGIMDRLQHEGRFDPPTMDSMERVLEEGLRRGQGRVFMDLWDVERLFRCARCGPVRRERLRRMNLSQEILAPVAGECACAV